MTKRLRKDKKKTSSSDTWFKFSSRLPIVLIFNERILQSVNCVKLHEPLGERTNYFIWLWLITINTILRLLSIIQNGCGLKRMNTK